ncbi:hypothetical protein COOONC_02416 [Cooperia oncophora]
MQESTDEQLPSASQLRRGISTESLDSSASSIMEVNREVPTANLTLKYDEATQMLSVQLHHLSDVYNDYGQIWMLFFLLPHPKPLWRTEARSTPSSFIDYNTIYQQCVRKADLNKDLSLGSGRDTPVELALLANKSKSPSDESTENVKLGEILFLASFAHDRLTKCHLRLSIVCGTDEYCKSIGHVTLGPKTSGKELGHWKRALSGEGPPLATWHAVRPRSKV